MDALLTIYGLIVLVIVVLSVRAVIAGIIDRRQMKQHIDILSPKEKRALKQIERDLAEDDPYLIGLFKQRGM